MRLRCAANARATALSHARAVTNADIHDDRVTTLVLNFGGLNGEIPPELGGLSNLVFMLLADNRLSGEIPPELGSLTKMSNLSLDGNQLTGPIPPELANMSYLFSLDLRGNEFTGCLPSALRAQLSHNTQGLAGLPFCT